MKTIGLCLILLGLWDYWNVGVMTIGLILVIIAPEEVHSNE